MKSFHVFILLVAIVFFLGSGCNDESTPSTPSTGDVIMPLKLGTSWTYLDQDLDTLGNVIGVDTTTFTIIGDTTINSEKWYTVNGDERLTNRSTGLWYGLFEQTEWIIAPALMAKHPGQAGDAWYGPDSMNATIAAVNVSTVVPHGTYSCYRYTYSSDGLLDVVRYFAVNKGLIRDEFYSTTASGRPYVEYRRSLMGLVLTKSVATPAKTIGRLLRSRMK